MNLSLNLNLSLRQREELAEEPRIIEGGFKVPEDIDSKKQRAATIRQRILRMFAC
jgi:hypothetical protein